MTPRRPHTSPERLSPQLAYKIQKRWGVIYDGAEIAAASLEHEHGPNIGFEGAEIVPETTPVVDNVVSLDEYRQSKLIQPAGYKAMEATAQHQNHIAELGHEAKRYAA